MASSGGFGTSNNAFGGFGGANSNKNNKKKVSKKQEIELENVISLMLESEDD